MTLVQETEALRAQLSAWANEPEWALLVRYELLPQKPLANWHARLRHHIGRLLRVLGLNRTRYRRQLWRAGLKHGMSSPEATVLLIWSEGHDRQVVRQACDGLKDTLADRTDLVPVLVTDVADFAYYSRLGWLVEYLPDLSGTGSSYGVRKRRYLAWRYRQATALPVTAGLANRNEFFALLATRKSDG